MKNIFLMISLAWTMGVHGENSPENLDWSDRLKLFYNSAKSNLNSVKNNIQTTVGEVISNPKRFLDGVENFNNLLKVAEIFAPEKVGSLKQKSPTAFKLAESLVEKREGFENLIDSLHNRDPWGSLKNLSTLLKEKEEEKLVPALQLAGLVGQLSAIKNLPLVEETKSKGKDKKTEEIDFNELKEGFNKGFNITEENDPEDILGEYSLGKTEYPFNKKYPSEAIEQESFQHSFENSFDDSEHPFETEPLLENPLKNEIK